MLQFFGYQIESHLRPDDAICNLCMNIMDNVAKLKRRLLPLIFRSEPSYMEDCKPLNFGKKWDVFASMNFDEDSDPFLNSRSPTPSNLLKCKRIVPYESPVEMKIAEIERNRSLSRISSAKSEADSEIIKVFSQKKSRKRKRGHNWSRRKNGRYSTISLELSSPGTVSTEENNLRYLNGCLQNKRTRSVSKRQEEEIRMYFKEDELHQCSEDNCSFICEDIDLMAQHKVTKHRQLALFWCNYCGKKYTSNGDLEIHKRTHAEQYSCAICHKEFYFDTDLLQHWQEHVKKSIPCRYCGKRFVDKNVCKKHQQNVHKRNIPSRIDYNKDVEQNHNKNSNF
ncbi:zinc finger protein weckle-like, partial [Asbolus verrucosus]